jgi:small subunit ribosomal protein S16
MLMMRLQRVGRKNDPSFRIVVTDKRNGPKSGKAIDQVGSYHPKTKHTIIDAAKVKQWLAQGVQPSPTLHNLLITNKIIEGKKVNVLSKKSPIIDEAAIKAAEEAKKAAEEAERAAKVAAEAEPVADDAPVEAKEEETVAA